jgi:diguanylate cyclase (GGDEF)-like protein/PAS domain S-box-containing protein
VKDEKKSKKQLIDELVQLRKKLSASEMKAAVKVLSPSEERLKYLLSCSPAVTYTCMATGDYAATFISDGIKAQLGYESKDFLEEPGFWSNNIHPEDKERVFKELAILFKTGHYVHEYRFKHKNGQYCWMRDELRLLSDDDGSPVEIVGSWLDITERVQLEEELKKTATIDKLTKAYNRVKFEEIIAIEMERATRYNHPLSILIIDIDDFKNVNDTCGHLAGDYVLKAISDILQSHMRKINHLIRWGGDEFIIVPVETGLDGASIFSERLRQAIDSFDFGKAGNITVSIGIALFNKDDTEDTFLKRADDALYKAKASGGNCVEASV